MKKIILLFVCIFCTAIASFSQSQEYKISGSIVDAETNDPLIGANIYDIEDELGTTTNAMGAFTIKAPVGIKNLKASYVGYQTISVEIDLQKDTTILIALRPTLNLETIEVTADNEESIEERVEMSSVSIPMNQINKLPALLGERDLIKALQLMPGVQSGGEGQAGLYVRGGSPDQNLILMDGIPIYNPNHVFGFFSIFQTDAIREADLIKGGYPARYGGRLSSVLDIQMKEGNTSELNGMASAGIVAAKGMLEGPIGKDGKTSFLIAGRRTYIDVLAAPLIEEGISPTVNFFDLNGKVAHQIDDKNKLIANFYWGKDNYGFREESENAVVNSLTDVGIDWGNFVASLQWNRKWNESLYHRISLYTTNYTFNNSILDKTSDKIDGTEILDFETRIGYGTAIRDVGLKFDFDYLWKDNHQLKFGVNSVLHRFDPGTFSLYAFNDGVVGTDTIIQQDKFSTVENALYIEDHWEVNPQLKINAGLHFSSFHVGSKSYFSIQPRISTRYLLPDKWSVKASFATMRQYIQLLTNENLNLPTDLWLPSTERIRPQDSWQVAAGVAKSLWNGFEFSFEAYYKQMKNVMSFREGASLFSFEDWQDRVTQGNGESYGMELLLQKKKGKFTGWIGYTLSWSWRQFDDINFGRKYPFRFDRRHDISVVGMYDFSDKIRISGTWVFGTGNAITIAREEFNWREASSGSSFFRSNVFSNFDEKNNYRAPSYHRLDIGLDFIKHKKWGKRTWSFGAYNAYNRANPFFVFSETEFNNNFEQREVLKQASLFPIIPYINLRYDF